VTISASVVDPFVGGGTTLHAAIIHGRRGLGCDIRDSQVALATRRLLDAEDARSA
jgi:tRNA G10  N-methylase Trm11